MSLLHRDVYLTESDTEAEVNLPNGDRVLVTVDGVVTLVIGDSAVNTTNMYFYEGTDTGGYS